MTVSAQSTRCNTLLRSIVAAHSRREGYIGRISKEQLIDYLERFSLWAGNIGAFQPPKSPLSLESRLSVSPDLLEYTLTLLGDLTDVSAELLDIVSGQRDGEAVSGGDLDSHEEESQCEETELGLEIGGCITRLFRVTGLIRRSARSEDRFTKALSRKRYQFDDHHDIAHVGEVFPKLATAERMWLRKRLGRANTERRIFLSYTRDHEEQLKKGLNFEEQDYSEQPQVHIRQEKPAVQTLQSEFMSRPSTFFTKASTLAADPITLLTLVEEEDTDLEDDIQSYTTISRSIDGGLDISSARRIPKLHDLPKGTKRAVQCSLCFRIKRFKNERAWRHHVFCDLRAYVCTFPDCDSAYFGNINDWFRHEMETHRVSYDCQLCGKKGYTTEHQFVAHIRRKHALILGDGGEQAVIATARKPLDRLQPSDCPCCTDWMDRLKTRALTDQVGDDCASDTIYVTPNVFKRHLASHLEHLALFSLPMPDFSAEEGAMETATDEDAGYAMSHRSIHSLLSFESPTSRSRLEPSVSGDAINEKQLEELVNTPHLTPFPANDSGTAEATEHGELRGPPETATDLNASARIKERTSSDTENSLGVLAKPTSAPGRSNDKTSFQQSSLEKSLEDTGTADPSINLLERQRLADEVESKALPDLSKIDGPPGPTVDNTASFTSPEMPLPAVVIDEVAALTQDNGSRQEGSSQSTAGADPRPGNSTSSPQAFITNIHEFVKNDSLTKLMATENDATEAGIASLPHYEAATGNVDKSSPDATPYPSFLKPQEATELDTKWHDLDWAQLERLREGKYTEGEEPPQWACCTGDQYAPRNRYVSLGPYQANRVRLAVPEDASDYINASPITLVTTRTKSVLRYIVTQGPKADTWPHFWRMLWHETQSPAVVVMLTKTHEQGREKCYLYYPQSESDVDLVVNEHDEFGDGFIQNLRLSGCSRSSGDCTETREIEVTHHSRGIDRMSRGKEDTTNSNHEIGSRKVWHLLFKGWPDFLIPEGHENLLETIARSRYMNASTDNPLIVHDSAGVGRTGTFIALDWLLQELSEGSLDDPPVDYDPIVHVIKLLRDQRPFMVQSKQLFLFLYDILREQWQKRWIRLHPDEANRLGVTATKADNPYRVAKKQESHVEYGGDPIYTDAAK